MLQTSRKTYSEGSLLFVFVFNIRMTRFLLSIVAMWFQIYRTSNSRREDLAISEMAESTPIARERRSWREGSLHVPRPILQLKLTGAGLDQHSD